MYYSAYLPLNFSIGRLCFIVQSIVKKRLFIAFIAKLLTDCSFDYNYSQKKQTQLMRGLFFGIYLQGIIITEIDNPMYNRFSFIFHLKKLKRKSLLLVILLLLHLPILND
ncbi:hypothetical protein DTQ80_10390 [Listeria monocytogenes]|nr:hypothetical protein [Listeria monocytogenes]EAC8233748.1 hypothetical protein [Listeria monocytogenes]EAC8842627.1 hypothetical protein [Listeria monocytogenes]EAC9604711.1 hypothetical protein [Listeria monocytogenes]EAD0271017.1 hypothetical protein [Listeria monocytogenes]